jgi:predicted Zn finger-like uncharacterized protein
MFTRCPHCRTVYPLTARLLAQGRGRLGCTECGLEFDAFERLADSVEALDRVGSAEPVAAVQVAQPDMFAPTPAFGAGAELPTPSFVRPAPPPMRWRGAWLAAGLLLAAALGLQILLAQRHELAAQPQWRAVLEPLCRTLRCELPAWREPRALALTAREIVPHPSVADALLVTATLRNDADWPQAWPLLELSLADLDGRPIGMRRFRPDEYLGGPPPQPALDPGQSAVARLEIADPGKQAVAFEFDFR